MLPELVLGKIHNFLDLKDFHEKEPYLYQKILAHVKEMSQYLNIPLYLVQLLLNRALKVLCIDIKVMQVMKK